jgi:hypothetical protein
MFSDSQKSSPLSDLANKVAFIIDVIFIFITII